MDIRHTTFWGVAFAMVCLSSPLAQAESSRFYELEGFGHFLDGDPVSTAVTEDGAITLPAAVHERFVDTTAAFGAATLRGDDVIAARVEDGQVVVIAPDGKLKVLYHPPQTMVTALLATDEKNILVAAGPQAQIYRVNKDGAATAFYAPAASYVWQMIPGPDGSIYVVTGEPGSLIKIDKHGKGTVLFSSEQAHLRSVEYKPGFGLFVGGGERGVVFYSEKESGPFRALYDSGLTEVTSIVAQPPYVYAAAVTGAAALVGDDGGESKKPAKGGKPADLDVRSQLVKIGLDGTSELLAGSTDEAIFALALDGHGRVIVATGATGRDEPRGRLYSVDPVERMIAMTYQAPSRRLTHLLANNKHLIALAAGGGRVIEFDQSTARRGEFLTLPFDAGINAHFGLLRLFGSWPSGSSATAAVRTGQTIIPDASWSAWTEEVAAPAGQLNAKTQGRYLQVRVTLKSDGKVLPQLTRLSVAYLRQNVAPFVREVVALRKGLSLQAMPRDDAKSKTVSLADKATSDEVRSGDTDDKRTFTMPRARQVEETGALTIKWLADDPNGDMLRFDLFLRREGEKEWRLLKAGIDDFFYSLKSTQLPDGYYQFRVRASDALGNAPGTDKQDMRESRAVLVDNTPPSIDSLAVRMNGAQAFLKAVIRDTASPLTAAQVSVDGGEFMMLTPDDGILDGLSDAVSVNLGQLSAGRHSVTVRAIDDAANEGFAQTSFDVR